MKVNVTSTEQIILIPSNEAAFEISQITPNTMLDFVSDVDTIDMESVIKR